MEAMIPADVPPGRHQDYEENLTDATHGTGRLMLFAGDQKVEHLNDDFYGESSLGPISHDDLDPEHLFRIASQAMIGVFATQFGMVARYGPSYPKLPYLIKMNSKTHLVKTKDQDPVSRSLVDLKHVVRMRRDGKLNILGVGYTIYLGSKREAEMLTEAAHLVADAHEHGLLVVLWIYPRGAAVTAEKDPHLLAGATGVALTLGADFVKVNYPGDGDQPAAEAFKEAVQAAGRTAVVCAGGSSTDTEGFLKRLHDQIHISGAKGNATGRNIHQKPLADAVRMCDAISSITFGDRDVAFAMRVWNGTATFGPDDLETDEEKPGPEVPDPPG